MRYSRFKDEVDGSQGLVLRALDQADGPMNGDDIAEATEVERTTVYKMIERLNKRLLDVGREIINAPGGYLLVTSGRAAALREPTKVTRANLADVLAIDTKLRGLGSAINLITFLAKHCREFTAEELTTALDCQINTLHKMLERARALLDETDHGFVISTYTYSNHHYTYKLESVR